MTAIWSVFLGGCDQHVVRNFCPRCRSKVADARDSISGNGRRTPLGTKHVHVPGKSHWASDVMHQDGRVSWLPERLLGVDVRIRLLLLIRLARRWNLVNTLKKCVLVHSSEICFQMNSALSRQLCCSSAAHIIATCETLMHWRPTASISHCTCVQLVAEKGNVRCGGCALATNTFCWQRAPQDCHAHGPRKFCAFHHELSRP